MADSTLYLCKKCSKLASQKKTKQKCVLKKLIRQWNRLHGERFQSVVLKICLFLEFHEYRTLYIEFLKSQGFEQKNVIVRVRERLLFRQS